jgi:hypothetical protein
LGKPDKEETEEILTTGFQVAGLLMMMPIAAIHPAFCRFSRAESRFGQREGTEGFRELEP